MKINSQNKKMKIKKNKNIIILCTFKDRNINIKNLF